MHSDSFESKRANQTANPVLTKTTDQALPEFGSVKDACRIFGLGRTKVFHYCKTGAIKSCVLRDKGRLTGRKLIYLPSVREFLFRQMVSQAPTEGCRKADKP